MKTARLSALIPLLLLGGCAAGAYCEGEQDYEGAQSVPVVQPTGDLRVKDSASALKIPPAPANAVPYGEPYKDEDGDTATRCLDRPPDMPPLAEPKAEDKPVEPKPEEKPAAPG